MISQHESFFHTPNHDLTISYSPNKMIITAKLKKPFLVGLLYVAPSLIFYFLGIVALFILLINNKFSGFQITNQKVLIGFLSIIATFFLSLLIYKLYFRSLRKKRISYLDRKIREFNGLFFIPIIFLSTLQNLNPTIDFIFWVPFLFLFSSLNLIGFFAFKCRMTIITISKSESQGLVIQSKLMIPLTLFAPSFLISELNSISFSTNGILLFILPFEKSAIQSKIELHGRKLLNYQSLSLEEAINKAEEKNLFILGITDKQFEFGKNTGGFIGFKISIELVQEILHFMNQFTFTEVIKLENKSEKDFVNFASSNPITPSKQVKKAVIVLSGMIIVPLYTFTLFFSAFLIYLIIIVPEPNTKFVLFMPLFLSLIILLLPIFIFIAIRSAKEKNRSILDKYDII